MIRKIFTLSALLALAAVSTAVLVGCSDSGRDAPSGATPNSASSPQIAVNKTGSDAEHAHKPGQHGGIIVEIGRDNYHAEAVFEKGASCGCTCSARMRRRSRRSSRRR